MKPVLVTGGGQGLGAEICRSLAHKGHDLVIHYRTNEKKALSLSVECQQSGVSVETIQGDFSTLESLETFIKTYQERFSQTKGVVNNVGNYLIAPGSETTPQEWLHLFQTNFFAPVFLTHALVPSLRVQKGSVVNIGVTGLQTSRGFSETTAYAAAKSALFFHTLSLAKELAEAEVSVNMVSPGYMENAVDLGDLSKIPFHRPAFLSEVAHIVTEFFDERFAYITGQNIEVGGGVGL